MVVIGGDIHEKLFGVPVEDRGKVWRNKPRDELHYSNNDQGNASIPAVMLKFKSTVS